MKRKNLILIIGFTLLITGCQNTDLVTNTNIVVNKTSPTPSVSPTISDEEKEERFEEALAERNKAITEFINKNYKGWQMKGISNEFGECNEDETDPCNLLIVNGQQEKVVAVKIKRFTFTDGQKHLVVFEARPIDLSKAKIEKIKESVLNNLEYEDCAEICDVHKE